MQSMADLEAEVEQFIVDDNDFQSPRNKGKPLANMLKIKHLGMYLQFVLFGIGSVLPIFVIFAAVDYFDNIFPGREPEFVLNMIYNPLLFCGSLVNLVYGRASSFKWRILVSFSVMAVCMLAFIVLDQLELCGSMCIRAHFWTILVVTAVLGLADAVCQSTLFGLTTHALPPLYTQGLMFGVGLCGLLITILRIITKHATENMHLSSYYYFGATAGFILLIIFLYMRLARAEAFRLYYFKASRHNSENEWKHPFQKLVYFAADAVKVLHHKRVFCYCFLITVVSMQQFMVVPSVITMAKDFLGHGWFPVLLILVFSIGDLIGRGPLALFYTCELHFAWLMTLIRFSLVIGIYLSVPPFVLSSRPAWMATFVSVLGLSSGHLTTSLISCASTDVPGSAKETVGYLGVLSMTLGMAGGSVASLFLKALIDKAQ